MAAIGSLCLFCGSRPGHDAVHAAEAAAVGRLLAERGVRLVFGGGAIGLMGITARAAKAAGGRVEGVIPHFLMREEIAQAGLDELVVVASLHARKAEMHARADAFLVLPGGIGTLDELFETLTWRDLGLHAKPIWLLGAGGYWNPLAALVAHLCESGFVGGGVPGTLEFLGDLAALESRL